MPINSNLIHVRLHGRNNRVSRLAKNDPAPPDFCTEPAVRLVPGRHTRVTRPIAPRTDH
ncbi:Uncharacterised protein [Mycobacteroides abscessus subsp. abscessus]|nr:Uncharacterised protein [Mycobacteroides abscessus subsp. abscessus]